jgi:molybdate transport system substrate-binding protein
MNRAVRLSAALVAAVHGLLAAAPVAAAEIRVAVAANFIEPVKEIGALFAKATGHQAVFSPGGTGQLYAQITQDAPFEVFLAADEATPKKAVDQGFAVAGSRFTYATGRLALFSRDPALVRGEATLREGRFTKLAVANPATAPYGAAAVEVMKALGVYDGLAARLVQGNNIAQTYQFVATANAELGFVALSQIARQAEGSRWLVPDSLHAPIAQDAVLLQRGADSEAARAFLAFLRGPESRAVVAKFGYGTAD